MAVKIYFYIIDYVLLKKFCRLYNYSYICTPETNTLIEIWCNGSTRDSGSLGPSSSLGISTK